MIFVGDDWAEDHHDVHLMDESGARLSWRRLPEGLAGIGEFHQLLASHAEEPDQVVIGIETDRGLWVEALISAGYQVYGINPLAVARYRDRHYVSGAKSDAGTPNCWPIWCAPIATTTAELPVTLLMAKRSRCWPGHIRI